MTQHARLIAELNARLDALTARSEAIEDDLRRPLDADYAEQAIDLADDEALAGVDDLIQREILEINGTLWRIENGTYGVCSACGEPIANERLAALPTASRCVNCA